jgi:hypothetical protein
MKNKTIFIRLAILLIFTFCGSISKAQILDVPYRNDLTGCGLWCWAKSCHMVIVYYGNDIQLCDVLEIARQKEIPNNAYFGFTNCCTNPYGSCCKAYWASGLIGILNYWSISNIHLGRALTLNEIQSDLQNNRPVIITVVDAGGTGGHTVVGYGLDNNDVFIQDPGNGSQIRDYDDLTQGTIQVWDETNRMTTSASDCILVQNVSGKINSANSVYKAENLIKSSCIINNNSNIEFLCENEVILKEGFEIQLGSSLSIETGINLVCP